MEIVHKEALRKSRVFLVTNIIPDSLWDHLVSRGIFTDLMLEYIKCKTPRSEQIRQLLADLNRRPPHAYQSFLECLRDTGQSHCVDEIKKNEIIVRRERGLSVVTQETLEPRRDLPTNEETRGSSIQPSAPDMDVEMASDIPHPAVPVSHPQTPDYWSVININPEDVYRMESSPRGIVYIINNHKFQHLSARPGSEKDETAIRNLFEHLDFSVYFDRDLSAKEMDTKLSLFSQFEALGRVDCCVVVILTHGSDQKMYGVDTRGDDQCFITDADLKKYFGNQNCSLLTGKPKLFLIQACRGNNEDAGCPSNCSLPSNQPSENTQADVTEMGGSPSQEESRQPLSNNSMQSLPNPTDMILAHSSDEGFVSYRNTEEGSIFITNVVDVFKENAHKMHVMDMLTKVNQRVAENFTGPDGMKTMPSPTNLLLKKWFLNPITSCTS